MVKSPGLRVFWYVLVGIVLIIATTWVSEIKPVRAFFHGNESPDWLSAQIETAVILVIGIPLLILIYRLLTRIEQLESYITMCAWCRKLNHDAEWVTTDEYLRRHYDTETSHGMCPDCRSRMDTEIAELQFLSAQEQE